VHRKLSALSAYYKYCMLSNLRSDNPCAGIKKPKKPSRLPMFLDAHATQRLFETIARLNSQFDFASTRDAIMLRLLIETGLRRAELIELKRSDVDVSYKRIRVLGKRNKVRLIPLSDDFVNSINRYITERDEFAKNLDCIQLLVSDKGQKMTTNFVHQKINTYLSEITTIKKKSPHVMRHSFATGMLNNGANLQAIRELLGHTSLAATQVYTHNSIGKLRQIHHNKHPRS
ncbi:MAG: tyrosine-type recombinase/integrase, partial [Flavobacteriales bacterium]